MARKKRTNPLLIAARSYVSQYVPELKAAPLQLHLLDSPPGSPSYAVTAEACLAGDCPNGVAASVVERGRCTVRDRGRAARSLPVYRDADVSIFP